IKSALPEKIVGADLVWDLAKMASENNLSIFLLGGFGNTPELAKQKLISQFPNLSISVSNKNPDNASVVEDINRTSSDILFVAYGPIKQEKWIADNLASLDIKLAVGVGGSFDYIAGTKSAPPKFIRYAGLEWLWRLITQPYRLKRIINATFGLVNNTVLFKINSAMSLRKNVACVIINNENKILTCQRNPKPQKGHSLGEGLDKFKNYWQLPQGGIDAGEDLILAAKREAYEETGLKNLEFIKTSEKTNNYHFPPQWGKVFQKHYRFSGQSQNIVYLKFAGNNNEVKVDNREFVNYQWADVNKLSQLVHNERLNLIKIITEDLKDLA
ncbi:MAG TPA: WecB/TagA/CpsF family glycosyltransferase, partial [Candidatus Limnocylindria bacterium]|nr:WecB/TagA/CpsF family glycosyltransferase [Candidatus Limnocylindria bacterium]